MRTACPNGQFVSISYDALVNAAPAYQTTQSQLATAIATNTTQGNQITALQTVNNQQGTAITLLQSSNQSQAASIQQLQTQITQLQQSNPIGGGIVPPLSISDAGTVLSAIALIWAVAYGIRMIIDFIRSSAAIAREN